MKATKIHDIIKDVTLMRLASEITVNRLFENLSLQEIVNEINEYIETHKLPFRIASPGEGKVEYLRLDYERLDRVIYLLSWLIKYEPN